MARRCSSRFRRPRSPRARARRSSSCWEREGTFEQLRERNRGGAALLLHRRADHGEQPDGRPPRLGPHAEGRLPALQGDARLRPALPERLRLPGAVGRGRGREGARASTRSARSRSTASPSSPRAAASASREFAEVITEQSTRLGMWMDWDNDYYTFSDTNIEYIWRFLKEVHERGWLYKGHRSTQWCPRCGTSLSQHEQAGEGNYVELEHPSLYVRFPLRDREGEALVVWTTTPWTLPANVAAAVKPDAEYGLRETATGSASARARTRTYDAAVVRGEELVGLGTTARSTTCRPRSGVAHRVIPWDEVALDEGTGIVHIAPGCGAEDFELGARPRPARARADRRVGPHASRLRRARGALDRRGRGAGHRGRCASAGLLVEAGRIDAPLPDLLALQDAARLPRRRRLVHLRATRSGSRCSTRTRRSSGRRRSTGSGWTTGCATWATGTSPASATSACRCRSIPASCGAAERDRLARGARGARRRAGSTGCRSCTGPGSTRCRSAARRAADDVERIPEVGDAWLDAGIVPFSTLGWQNPEWVPSTATRPGPRAGLTGADLPDHAYWEKWFPADWVSEMREQIRLWFYSQCFMAVTLDGPRAVPARARVREGATTRPAARCTSRGATRSRLDEALERMGADVMRWLYCDAGAEPEPATSATGRPNEVKRRLLTFWNSVSFFVTYANIEGFDPATRRPASSKPLDRWLVSRTAAARRATRPTRTSATGRPRRSRRSRRFVDDLSNWYIRRSRRRFWDGDAAALRALWDALAQALRVIAPVMPFLAEQLWRNLVSDDAPSRSSSPAGRRPASATRRCWPRWPRSARSSTLGRQARAASGLKQRQPLRRLVVAGRGARGRARGRDPRRAARQGGRVRRGRGDASCA